MKDLFSFNVPQPPDQYCGSCQKITIDLRLKSPLTFSFDEYSAQIEDWFTTGLSLNPKQVAATSYAWISGPRLNVTILIYPSNESSTFRASEFEYIFSNIVQWNLTGRVPLGPWELLAFYPRSLEGLLLHLLLKFVSCLNLGIRILGFWGFGILIELMEW